MRKFAAAEEIGCLRKQTAMYQSRGTSLEPSAKIGPNANLRLIGLRLRSERLRTGTTR